MAGADEHLAVGDDWRGELDAQPSAVGCILRAVVDFLITSVIGA